jgi:transcription-repair coupling factor (superfamily II helicase)
LTELKQQAQQLGIKKLEASSANGRIEFASETQVNPLTIVKMVQTQPQKYRLEGASHLKFFLDMENSDRRIKSVKTLLDQLTQAA